MTVTEGEDPITLFERWLREASESEPSDPTAMSLATADANGRPSARMVLLKGVDARGFTFYTNLESRKAEQLAENAQAALCFHWKSQRRQVRVEGAVALVSTEEANEYFASRPRLSQVGAWASKQSRPLESRFELEKRVAEFTAKFHIGKVPRPDFWSGYRVIPDMIEFWEERQFRLHERMVYTRDGEDWTMQRLYP